MTNMINFMNCFFSAPPSYEECISGRVNISEENEDTQYTRGELSYAPVYPCYTSLATGIPTTLPPSYTPGPPPPGANIV